MNHTIFTFIVLTSALGPIGIQSYLTAIPEIESSLGLKTSTVQWSLSLSVLVGAMAAFAYGPLSDRLGRKPTLITGLVLFALGTWMISQATDAMVLTLGRLVQVVGTSCGYVLGRAIARDVYGEKGLTEILGLLGFLLMIAPLGIPYFAGLVIETNGWRVVFMIQTALIVLYILVTLIFLRETNPKTGAQRNTKTERSKSTTQVCVELLKHRGFLFFTFCNSVALATYFAFLTGAPHLLTKTFGGEPTDYGESYFWVGLGYMAGSLLASRAARKLNEFTLICSGAVVLVSGLGFLIAVGLTVGLSQVSLTAGFFIATVGVAAILPAAISMATGFGGEAHGTAASVNHTIETLFCAFVVQVIGYLNFTSLAGFLVLLAVLAILMVSIVLLIGMNNRKTDSTLE